MSAVERFHGGMTPTQVCERDWHWRATTGCQPVQYEDLTTIGADQLRRGEATARDKHTRKLCATAFVSAVARETADGGKCNRGFSDGARLLRCEREIGHALPVVHRLNHLVLQGSLRPEVMGALGGSGPRVEVSYHSLEVERTEAVLQQFG